MGAAALAAGGVSAAGGLYSAAAAGAAGDAQAGYYGYLADSARTNAGLAEASAESDRKQINAETLSEQVGLTSRIAQTIGAQKAAVVTGVGAGSRSAQQIIGDTLDKGNLDEMALRLDADMKSRSAEARGKMGVVNAMSQAGGYELAGANARSMGKLNQTSSLLGTAGSVANSWYMANLYAGGSRPRIGAVNG